MSQEPPSAEPKPEESTGTPKSSLNREISVKQILITLLVAGAAAGAYFGYQFLQEQREIAAAQEPWRLQAEGFAREFELSPDESAAFTDLYVGRRTKFLKATRAIDPSDGIGRGMTFRDARIELRARLNEMFDGERAEKTTTVLLTFDDRYDDLVLSLDGLGLAEDDFYAAMEHLHGFIYDLAKAQEQAFKQGAQARIDRTTKAMDARAAADAGAKSDDAPSTPEAKPAPEAQKAQREAMRRMTQVFISTKKKQLDDNLADILSDEQMAQWKEVSSFDV